MQIPSYNTNPAVVGNPELLRIVELQVNPTLDALNNAFETFDRVVKVRRSVSTALLVESVREMLITFVNNITMQMNTGNITGLVYQLSTAESLTHNVEEITNRIRYQNEIRGFRTE